MLKAIAVTFIIFAILFSGIIALKRSANHWKVPKGVKPQPYDNEKQSDEGSSDNDHKNEAPQLTDQSKPGSDQKQADKQQADTQDKP